MTKTKALKDVPLMKMWFGPEGLYLWVEARSGLFTFDFPDGHRCDWLVDLDLSERLTGNGTIYKYQGTYKTSPKAKLLTSKEE